MTADRRGCSCALKLGQVQSMKSPQIYTEIYCISISDVVLHSLLSLSLTSLAERLSLTRLKNQGSI